MLQDQDSTQAQATAGKAHADSVDLSYVSDEQPGITRRRAGHGFSYWSHTGRRLTATADLARIRALAIPPAWTEVWICPDADGHIQATGRDVRGRKQYRYHERWSACRDEVKYGSLARFAKALPDLRAAVDADLRKRTLSIDRVSAAVVWLLDNTLIRVGNSAYARDNKSFGLTTLRDRHVDVSGSKLRFAFRGKSGKEWVLQLADRRIARIVRGVQDLPGQHLFQYIGDDGARHPLGSNNVNAYIRAAIGDDFSSKHFRTWGATVHAATLFADIAPPESEAALKRTLNATIDKVAARLGNTRAVCRSCYIHPAVMEQWRAGELAKAMTAAKRGRRGSENGLDSDEASVLRWLIKYSG